MQFLKLPLEKESAEMDLDKTLMLTQPVLSFACIGQSTTLVQFNDKLVMYVV